MHQLTAWKLALCVGERSQAMSIAGAGNDRPGAVMRLATSLRMTRCGWRWRRRTAPRLRWRR